MFTLTKGTTQNWLLIIIIVLLIAGGIFAWQYWGVKKEVNSERFSQILSTFRFIE